MSDENNDKPTLTRKPLTLSRSLESGEVKQTFSHGRTNKVVVEVKRKKLVGKPGYAPEPETAAPPPPPPPVAAPVTAAPAPAADPAPKARPTSNDMLSRQERQAKLLREAEEARLAMLEESSRREAEQRAQRAEEERQRGASVTDIVILVVAADDGLMPQTIEAIKHAKAANVPMIVAINKIDKDGANPQRVRERLLEHEVVVEAMGGDVQDVEVSALKKTGLDTLLEKLALQAELMELKANPDRAAEAVVVEAQLDKGRGAVATVLVKRGTLKRGDIFVVGAQSGKVRALVNEKGQQVSEAGPATPVEVLGLTGVPSAGDVLTVVENEARAREVALYRKEQSTKVRTAQVTPNLENLFDNLSATRAKEYPRQLRWQSVTVCV